MRRLATCICALPAAIALLPAAIARAEFAPATLISNVPPTQFDEARSPAFSSNGEYVAFRGSLDGVPGIYRRDLRTGEVALVAGESSQAELDAPEAAAPSISAEGRYVAFTTAHDLDAADDTGSGCPEVYVRDMGQTLQPDRLAEEAGEAAERPYVLASAANGTSRGLEYEKPCGAGVAGALALGGSQAAAGVALSANGHEVAFTVLGASDLTGPCSGAPLKCPTEPSQVAVRNLQTQTTTLISATPAGQPVPGGGAFPSGQSEQRMSGSLGGAEVASAAAISAEGDAVAWQGTNVPEQVAGATDVTTGMASYGGAGLEVEPLWRAIAEGAPTGATQRMLAGAGLDFYFGDSHESSDMAIEGGALAPVQQAFVAPALSANGQTAAVISNAPTHANQASYEESGLHPQLPPADAYVVHLGGSSPQVAPLTATPDFAATNAIIDGVSNVAISPDGTRVAFDTKRVSFALAPPVLITTPVAETTYAYTYEANLSAGTLQRVTDTYNGAPPQGEAGQISLAGNDRTLAFASAAGNLFYGDATPGVPQVFTAEEIVSEEQPTPQAIGTPPALSLPAPEWLLSATVHAQSDGSVVVYAEVPGAGTLEVHATAQLSATGAGAGTAAARRARRARRARARASARTVTATIAHAQMVAGGPAQLRLSLSAGSAYRARIASRDGLYAVLSLSFRAPGHPSLQDQVPVTFRRAPGGRAKKAKSRKGRHSSKDKVARQAPGTARR